MGGAGNKREEEEGLSYVFVWHITDDKSGKRYDGTVPFGCICVCQKANTGRIFFQDLCRDKSGYIPIAAKRR